MENDNRRERGKAAIARIVDVVDRDVTYHIPIPLYNDSPEYPTSVEVSSENMAVIPDMGTSPICTYHLIDRGKGELAVLRIPATIDAPVIPAVLDEAEARKYGVVFPKDKKSNEIQEFPSDIDRPREIEIYQPAPIDKTVFAQVDPKHSTGVGVGIYRDMKQKLLIKVYCEEFYLFNPEEGLYQKYSDADFDRVINQFYGDTIANADDLQAYNAIKEYLRKDYELTVREETMLPPNWWVFRNGIVNIVTGECVKNIGQYFVTTVLQTDYDPMATCPKFDQYVSAVTGGNTEMIKRMKEVTAYLLSRDTNAKAFFELLGEKDTGKSVYGRLLTGIVGSSAVAYLSADDFNSQFAVAELNGKQLNLCMDLTGSPFSATTIGRIKSITGGDVIRSDVKYKAAVYFKPTVRLVFGTNSSINTAVMDKAFEDRKVTLHFINPVPKEKQIYSLDEELLKEAAGIVNEMIPYYLDLVKHRYHFTEVDYTEEDKFRIDTNKVIEAFVDERITITENQSDGLTTDSLYSEYKNFCFNKTIEPVSLAKFSENFHKLLGERAPKEKRRFDGKEPVWGFLGIKFKK